MTPASEADKDVLQDAQSAIEAALARHVGLRPGDQHRSTLRVGIQRASQHPARARHAELSAALYEAIAASGVGASGVDDMIAMRDALNRGRLGLAGSASCGRYDVIIAPDISEEERVALEGRMQSVDNALHARAKQLRRTGQAVDGVYVNNYAPVAADLSTATALARLPRARQSEEHDIVVGVITPGGSAAPRDVLGKLEQLPGVSLQTVTVRRGDPALTATMVRAVDALCLSAPAAIVVDYGGGEREQLDQVFDALQLALANRSVPMYVGIGHRNYERALDSPLVRMCATPADAAELFRIEVLDIPRRRADLVAGASADLLLAVGHPGRSAQVATMLAGQLGQLDLELKRARDAHGQPTSS
ncbi:hypothetical protein FHR93_002409 [Geodermatophilus sabuli]|uniref:hypothetical protein n=1 Tax=Geodermatophilus sabuli TaxID=1564158 RepID=UPI0016086499|nr:hypothetical protein [Geodermatophilus sabuli]MBB3084195.1 hypothetical protein [Geodermatophilus sabuli]